MLLDSGRVEVGALESRHGGVSRASRLKYNKSVSDDGGLVKIRFRDRALHADLYSVDSGDRGPGISIFSGSGRRDRSLQGWMRPG